MSKYTVASLDAWQFPPRAGAQQPRWLKRGEFDDPAEAVACANQIVRAELEALYRENPKTDAEGLLTAFWSFAEVPSVFGEPEAGAALGWHIRQITGRSAPDRDAM